MNASDLHHLSGAYALDALDAEEREAFEAHFPSCEICRREVEQFQATAAMLAAATEAEPPADLRARVLADVSRTRQVSPLVPEPGRPGWAATEGPGDELAGRRRLRPQRWLAAVAAVVLVAVSITVWRSVDGGDQPGDDVAVNEILADPAALITDLDDTGGIGAQPLRVAWLRDRGEVAVVGDAVAAAGQGSTYALWLLTPDGRAMPAGLFEPDESGRVSVVLPLDAEVAAGFGVTIEPEGGSLQPTPPVLYLGEF